MPAMFSDWPTYLVCAAIIALGQIVYATVGFGAGMISVALLALVLPDLAGPVAVLLVLTFVTEVSVLSHAWRHARLRLLLWLLPGMAVGLWLGARLLSSADVEPLKRLLGVVVAVAGIWFLLGQRSTRNSEPEVRTDGESASEVGTDIAGNGKRMPIGRWLVCLPVGLVSGVLGGLFGTGGPPVIVFLRAFGLEKGAFRATLLCFFLMMSVTRAPVYLNAGLLGKDELYAAFWLMPPSLIGMLAGMFIHRKLPERHFRVGVAWLLVLLGALLVVGVGKG